MILPTARRRDVLSVVTPTLGGLAAAIVLAMAGCAAPPPPPPPTVVNLTLKTTADLNPTESGQGAPVIVRVYQLKSAAAFEKAEFFRLFNGDAAALGADIVKKDEYLLAPNTTKAVELSPDAAAKTIGVFAAYRDFQHVTWRGTADIPANKTTDVLVTADGKGVAVKATPAPPPAKPAS